MLTFLNIYFGGMYLSLLLYALSLEHDGFREHVASICKDLLDGTFNHTMHPYTLMNNLVVFFSVFSWFNICMLIALIIDYNISKKEYEITDED